MPPATFYWYNNLIAEIVAGGSRRRAPTGFRCAWEPEV